MTGVAEEGLCGHPSPSSPSGVRGGASAEIKFSAFLPSRPKESELSDFVVFGST